MNMKEARDMMETAIRLARLSDYIFETVPNRAHPAYTVAKDVAELEQLGDRAKRLAEQACNGIERYDAKAGRVLASWTEQDEARNEKALAAIRDKAQKIAGSYGLRVSQCGGDPRGSCLKLIDSRPDVKSNDFFF